MRSYMKKLLLTMCALSMIIVSGCSKEEEPVKEEKQLITNDVYEAPTNPTEEQITVYNELSNALASTTTNVDKLAELVAVNFAYEFFTLANKSGKDDVGGLTFIPEADREDFKTYAIYKYYTNYQTVVSQYSVDDLPNVIMHETQSVTADKFDYSQLVYDGYTVVLTLKYKDGKLPQDGLKTNVSLNVIDENGVYRVIAAEDSNTSGTDPNATKNGVTQ